MKAVNSRGEIVDIKEPGHAVGHVSPGDAPRNHLGYDYTQRGYDYRRENYYTAWWVVGGEIYTPVGDDRHRK